MLQIVQTEHLIQDISGSLRKSGETEAALIKGSEEYSFFLFVSFFSTHAL